MLFTETSHESRTLPSTFNKQQFEEKIETFASHAIESFKQITRHYALFHICFFLLGLLELLGLILFFSFLTRSALFAFTIAAAFFTGFSYFVLLFYFQAKKPQQLIELRNTFSEQCKTALPQQVGAYASHLSHVEALYYLLSGLHRQEYGYYTLGGRFKTLSLLMKKFSAWTHWKDVHQIKEMLWMMIIKQYVKLVQLHPSDLEIHAALATAFLSLAKLYVDPRKSAPDEEHLWISPDYHSTQMRTKFQTAALRAVEELRILDTYAPNDPWIHMQLAGIYQDLEMVEKEIKEYEIILTLSPKDQEALLRLGVLYFSQGENASALRLYERLKELNAAKAQELLSHYAATFIDEEPL